MTKELEKFFKESNNTHKGLLLSEEEGVYTLREKDGNLLVRIYGINAEKVISSAINAYNKGYLNGLNNVSG